MKNWAPSPRLSIRPSSSGTRRRGKRLEEHFFICLLHSYDISKRYGPEFEDPSRGEFIPVEIPLDRAALSRLNLMTPELRNWMCGHLEDLRNLQRLPARL